MPSGCKKSVTFKNFKKKTPNLSSPRIFDIFHSSFLQCLDIYNSQLTMWQFLKKNVLEAFRLQKSVTFKNLKWKMQNVSLPRVFEIFRFFFAMVNFGLRISSHCKKKWKISKNLGGDTFDVFYFIFLYLTLSLQPEGLQNIFFKKLSQD